MRYFNISGFHIYPDSYTGLAVAMNLTDYHSVTGFLGNGGMFYPDFFSWTRPGFPFLVNIFRFTGFDLFKSGTLISFFAGVISVLLAYFMLSTIFKNILFGLSGALLLSISFNHIVWGGFILTETAGVMFILLFLWLLFSGINILSQWGNLRDLLAGFLLAFSILIRYEYASLSLPVFLLILAINPFPLKKIINIFASAVFICFFVFFNLYPLSIISLSVLVQFQDSLKVLAAILTLIIMYIIFLIKFPGTTQRFFGHFLTVIAWIALPLLALIFMLQSVFKDKIFLFLPLTALRNFFINDFFLGILFILGIIFLNNKPKFKPVVYFCLSSIIILGSIYTQLNFQMQRYWTHLLPFFLVPAAYALVVILHQKRFLINLSLLVLISFQIYLSARGLRYWNNGAWFNSQNYEETAASKIPGSLIDSSTLLLVSRPEPYYFVTRLPVQSVADQYPFLFLDKTLADRNILIVEDAGMYRQFPKFNKIILNYLQHYEKTSYYTGQNYYSGNVIEPEKNAVRLYKIKLFELQKIIAGVH